jgi:hypothetical protein
MTPPSVIDLIEIWFVDTMIWLGGKHDMSHKLSILERQLHVVQKPDAENILPVESGAAFRMKLFANADHRQWNYISKFLWLDRSFVPVTYDHRLGIRTNTVRIGRVNKDRAWDMEREAVDIFSQLTRQIQEACL